MKIRKATAFAATIALAAITAACGSTGPDVAACKAAMKRDFVAGMTSQNATPATRPPACQGVDDKTIKRLAGEIITEELQKGP